LTAVKATAIIPAFHKPCRVKTTKSWRQKTSNKNAMQHTTTVTSVDSTRETQSWVHQPGELHAHIAVDFLHLPLLFNGENATQKNDQTNLKNVAL